MILPPVSVSVSVSVSISVSQYGEAMYLDPKVKPLKGYG